MTIKLKLELKWTKIKRVVTLPGDLNLADLHDILQALFGFEHDHLWNFQDRSGHEYNTCCDPFGGPLNMDTRGKLDPYDYAIESVMPNRNEALARESIDNLCSPLSNTLNEYIAKIKRSFRRYVLNDRLLQQYVIAGRRGQPYRVTLPPEQVTLPAVFR